MYQVNFILQDGTRKTVAAEEGEDLLSLAHRHKIQLEGACEGALACSTCHLIVREGWYDKTQNLEPSSDAEEDMLDYAFGLTSMSRLGCQIKMCKALDGIVVELPKATRNMQLEKMV